MTYPLKIEVPRYRGRNKTEMDKHYAFAQVVTKIEEYLNKQMLLQEKNSKEYSYIDISRALQISVDDVRRALHYPGSYNFIILQRPTLNDWL